jgi:uncharacterized protein (TIGR03435 family)
MRGASLILLCLISSAQAQTPVFKSASIKISRPGPGNPYFSHNPADFLSVGNLSLRALIAGAWPFPVERVIGGPAWIDSDRFDINARAGAPFDLDEVGPMIQTILEQQFRLKVHTETRQTPVFYLRVTPGGSKLPAGTECIDSPDCGQLITANAANWHGQSVTVSDLAEALTRNLNRPVIDQTGIEHKVNVRLTSSANVDLTASLARQLGLELREGTAQMEFLIIDHLERLTD